jgi:hypothetical protein
VWTSNGYTSKEGKPVYTAEQHQQELDYLTQYAKDDWVGFSPITAAASALLHGNCSAPAERELTVKLIRDMFETGARAGDITADPDNPFVPWDMDNDAALERIRLEMEALGHSPNSGEIGWIATY